MKNDASDTPYRSIVNLDEANEDGCIRGTAGREEDPNATTDWDHPDPAQTSEAARGQRPQPSSSKTKNVKLPANGTPGIDTVPPADISSAH